MLAILSKLVIVVMIAMIVPTGMVLASQEAIPGDVTYPIKRGLEGVIVSLASLHPATRAFFHADLTKRRFKEAIALMRRGSDASNTLVELVSQTQTAVDIIDKIPDASAKRVYIENLSTQIVEYKVSLKKFEDVSTVPLRIIEPTLQPATDNIPAEMKISPVPKSISPTPEIYVTPKVEPLPTPTPVKSKIIITTQPSPVILTPAALPPTVTPTHPTAKSDLAPPDEPTSIPRPTTRPTTRPTPLPTLSPPNIDECGSVGNTSHCLERILKKICDKNPDLRVCQSEPTQIRRSTVHKSLNEDTPSSAEMPRLEKSHDEIEESDDNVDTLANPNKGKNNPKNR